MQVKKLDLEVLLSPLDNKFITDSFKLWRFGRVCESKQALIFILFCIVYCKYAFLSQSVSGVSSKMGFLKM